MPRGRGGNSHPKHATTPTTGTYNRNSYRDPNSDGYGRGGGQQSSQSSHSSHSHSTHQGGPPSSPNVCTTCRRDFNTADRLLKHMEAEEGHGSWHYCTKCDYSFVTEETLREHMSAFHAQQHRPPMSPAAAPFSNNHSGSAMVAIAVGNPDNNNFSNAIPSNTSGNNTTTGRNVCTTCKQDFGTAEKLLYHMETYTNHGTWHYCTMCDYSFVTQDTLQDHVAAFHSSQPSGQQRRSDPRNNNYNTNQRAFAAVAASGSNSRGSNYSNQRGGYGSPSSPPYGSPYQQQPPQTAAGGGGFGVVGGPKKLSEGNSLTRESEKHYDGIVRQFVESDRLFLEFPSTLTAQERHYVHKLGMHYQLEHKSYGPAENRVLRLTKQGIPQSILAAALKAAGTTSSTPGVGGGTTAAGNDPNGAGGNGDDGNDEEEEAPPRVIDGFQGLQPLNDELLTRQTPEILKLCQEPIALMNSSLADFLRSVNAATIHRKSQNNPKKGGRVVVDGKQKFVEELKRQQPSIEQAWWHRQGIAPPQASNNDKAMKQQLKSFRENLPSYKMKQAVIDAVRNNTVTIVSSGTGCGKTTQVPQILLDAGCCGANGAIICTQPRRVSAISVARRVAQERGEACGNSVGYVIRFESVTSSATRILYVTTGILLRRLHRDKELKGVSIVIVDEVHERDVDTDFALLMLRDIIQRQQQLPHSSNTPKLKLIVMSATLQIDRLTRYFTSIPETSTTTLNVMDYGGADEDDAAMIAQQPVGNNSSGNSMFAGGVVHVSIPGSLFPVQEYWLDDVLQLLKLPFHSVPSMVAAMRVEEDMKKKKQQQQQQLQMAAAKKRKETGGGGVNGEKEAEEDAAAGDYEAMKQAALQAQEQLELETCVPYDVILKLIEWYHRENYHNRDNAILVFLPGWQAIQRVMEGLAKNHALVRELSILPLHSSISTTEQQRVFITPPKGFRKVVLSTNIAETSVTIDDIVCVIDSGLHKGTSYDSAGNTSSLASQLIAKANGQQRRGRAGRCRPGMCFHLLPKVTYDALPDFLKPEMLRTSLEEICLQVKAIVPDETEPCLGVLQRAMDPPHSLNILHAVSHLTAIGAFDQKERLTPLGRVLATMPMHPILGKMLLFSAVLGVFDPMCTMAASLSAKSPFIKPMPHEMLLARQAQLGFDNGRKSDHLSILSLYEQWKQAGSKKGDFAFSHFADNSQLHAIDRMRTQLKYLVINSGFLGRRSPSSNSNFSSPTATMMDDDAAASPTTTTFHVKKDRRGGTDSKESVLHGRERGLAWANRNANNEELLRYALLCSLFPRVAFFERDAKRRHGNIFCWDNKPCKIHPSSVLDRTNVRDIRDREFLVYFERMRIESLLCLFDVTAVTRTSVVLASRNVFACEKSQIHPLLVSDADSKFVALDYELVLQQQQQQQKEADRDDGIVPAATVFLQQPNNQNVQPPTAATLSSTTTTNTQLQSTSSTASSTSSPAPVNKGLPVVPSVASIAPGSPSGDTEPYFSPHSLPPLPPGFDQDTPSPILPSPFVVPGTTAAATAMNMAGGSGTSSGMNASPTATTATAPVMDDTKVLVVDNRKRFVVPSTVATAVMQLRELSEYFFALSIRNMAANSFPDKVVQALGLALGSPVTVKTEEEIFEQHRNSSSFAADTTGANSGRYGYGGGVGVGSPATLPSPITLAPSSRMSTCTTGTLDDDDSLFEIEGPSNARFGDDEQKNDDDDGDDEDNSAPEVDDDPVDMDTAVVAATATGTTAAVMGVPTGGQQHRGVVVLSATEEEVLSRAFGDISWIARHSASMQLQQQSQAIVTGSGVVATAITPTSTTKTTTTATTAITNKKAAGGAVMKGTEEEEDEKVTTTPSMDDDDDDDDIVVLNLANAP